MAAKIPDVIDLLCDDSDDESDTGQPFPTTAKAVTTVAIGGAKAGTKRAWSATAAASPSFSGARTNPYGEVCDPSYSSNNSGSRISGGADRRNHRLNGCMLRPSPSPIKLFATRQDEQLRATLPPPSWLSNTQAHWSYEHCWTVREMMGFDRFSGLLTEQPPAVGIDNNMNGSTTEKKLRQQDIQGTGIDWVLITTYLLNVSELLADIPELVKIPNVVIIYEYMNSEVQLNDPLSLVRAQHNPNPEDHNNSCLYWKRASADNIRKMKMDSKNGEYQPSKSPHESFRFRGVTFVRRTPRDQPGTGGNPLGLNGRKIPRMEYGCHHSKMFIIGYSSGRLRVNIHTSNLGQADLHLKCNAAYIQDFMPKRPDQLFELPSDFEETLISYLESYSLNDKCQWRVNDSSMTVETLTSHLQSYDFSTAVGILIPSVPGFHSPTARRDETKQKYGYLKLSQAIREKTPKPAECRPLSSPLVFQFSSFSTTHQKYLDKLVTAWDVDSVHGTNGNQNPYSMKLAALPLRLSIVWPTQNEVRSSVEGPMGGGSAPAKKLNVERAYLQPMLHRWTSSSKGGDDPYYKGCNVPHIKSFYQIDSSPGSTSCDMKWFCLTSHNISKASWGEIQNRRIEGQTLVVQHWELGVFLSPATLGTRRMGVSPMKTGMAESGVISDDHEDYSERAVIPLPYKFRPDPYLDGDEPWYTTE